MDSYQKTVAILEMYGIMIMSERTLPLFIYIIIKNIMILLF